MKNEQLFAAISATAIAVAALLFAAILTEGGTIRFGGLTAAPFLTVAAAFFTASRIARRKTAKA